MNAVVVTGIGLVSSLGKNLETNWKNLIAGKSGIKIHQPFLELEPRPVAMINEQPVGLKELTQLVVCLALEDANLITPLPDCGVVIGSSRGYQGIWESMIRELNQGELVVKNQEWGQKWVCSLPHMNAISVARQIGATGIVLAPMAACATGMWALSQAVFLIQTGQCQRVIAGGVEAPITPLTITGFEQMGAYAKNGAYPFDKNREGLVLGEGGAVFVLESLDLAVSRNANIYAKILGFGLTTDAYHPNSPEPEGKSATIAIKQCLERSDLETSDIDYIHAHGTGTILNDKVESLIIQRLFPQTTAVSSTKGATGHTIGASGSLGVAFSLLALKQQILPSCTGLKESEFDLNLVQEACESKIQKALCFSFGFGGQNAVIAMENW